jgi:DNA/RNA endonuclease G (NUC1)
MIIMKRALFFLLPLLVLSCYPGETDQRIDGYQKPDDNVTADEPYVRVSTGDATDISTISATLSGSWSEANATVREAGFMMGTSATVLDQVVQADLASTGASGSFSVELFELLDPSVTYYYCAYVQVQSGTTIKEYKGSVASFTTMEQPDVPEPPQPPAPAGSQPGWAELPVMNISTSGNYMINSTDNTQYYAWHISPDVKGPGNKLARNYTVCYSAEHHCPVWVAAPRHSMYVGSSGRTDAYGKDPNIPSDVQYNSKSTGGGCNKGHMLGSAERTCSSATNRQVFYYTNIAPQLSSAFNTGGGRWNVLEDFVDTQVCADTLYEVLGCYFDKYTDKYGETQNPSTISFGGRDDVSMPTMFYYVLLRTKSGSSGKAVQNCSASELKCVAFVRAHVNVKQKVTATELMSVADLEAITGVTFFPNVPNAPKTSFKASDWGL